MLDTLEQTTLFLVTLGLDYAYTDVLPEEQLHNVKAVNDLRSVRHRLDAVQGAEAYHVARNPR